MISSIKVAFKETVRAYELRKLDATTSGQPPISPNLAEKIAVSSWRLALWAHNVKGKSEAAYIEWCQATQFNDFCQNHPISDGECGLIADHGIGDHFLVCAFAEAIHSAYGLQVRVAGNPRYRFIQSLFPSVLSYADWPSGLSGEKFGALSLSEGAYFYTHFPQKGGLVSAIGYGQFHFLDAYRCRLGLEPHTLPSPPRPATATELEQAAAYLTDHGFVPARTAVLCIDARSIPTDAVSLKFWQSLADELSARGLQCVVNAGPQTPALPGVRALSLPLEQFRPIVQSAGYVCSIRSGLSDLLYGVPCANVVVYPDIRYCGGDLRQGTTFSRYNFAECPHEVTFSPDSKNEAVQEAVSYLVQHEASGVFDRQR